MVPAAQIPVQPENQLRLHARIVSPPHFGDIARQLPRSGIILPAQPANPANLLLRGRGRQALGKHSHHRMILLLAFVSADNVIVEHGLQVPALFFRHLREMLASVQPLLFARDREKNNRRRKFQLAQNPRAFQAHGRSAAVVVRPRSIGLHVESVAGSRIVVPRHQHNALCILRVRAFQSRINIGDHGRLRNSIGRRFGKAVGLPLQAAAAILGIALELRLNPFPRRSNSMSRLDRIWVLRGDRQPRPKAHQLLDIRSNPFRRNLLQSSRYAAIHGHWVRSALRQRSRTERQHQRNSPKPRSALVSRNHVSSCVRNVNTAAHYRRMKNFTLYSPRPLTSSGEESKYYQWYLTKVSNGPSRRNHGSLSRMRNESRCRGRRG